MRRLNGVISSAISKERKLHFPYPCQWPKSLESVIKLRAWLVVFLEPACSRSNIKYFLWVWIDRRKMQLALREQHGDMVFDVFAIHFALR